ncbi:MAG: tyrosine-type recombinase/integrase [Brevinematales bacterium]
MFHPEPRHVWSGFSRSGFSTLRHSAGTRFYKVTKDLLITQKILGHANAHETVRYAHVSGADIEETMKRVLG